MIKTEVIKDTGYELFQQLLSEKRKLIAEKLILDKKDNHKYPIENIPFNIPDNWHWCYLSDISIIQEGPGIRKHQYQDEGIQFLTVTNILEDAIDLEKSKKYISKSEYEKTYSHFTIKKGDIVTACSGGSWGKSAMFDLDDKLILNTSTLRLRFYNDLGDNRYLYYLTKTSYFKDSLSSYITGQQPNYGYSHYSKIPIPLPPLPEQQRIVSILDKAFAAIAKAKANAEQNLKNAKELFESYLQGMFEKKGNGWVEKTLEELADEKCTLSYGIVQPGEEFENGLPVIRPTDLTSRYIKLEGLKRIDPKLADGYKRTKLIGDELLLCVRGTTGVVSIATPELKDANVTRGIVPIRFNPKILNQEFGYYLLISNYVQKQIRAKTYGAALMQINIGDLRKILTPYPPIQEQQTIVRQLDALRAETQKLEAVYQKKIDDLEELKKSILQKAFAGELKTEKAVEV
jgi:type I restriction enzyme S subunit